jgi:hypothetical protein
MAAAEASRRGAAVGVMQLPSAAKRVLLGAANARLVAEDCACVGLIPRVNALAGCGDEECPQVWAAERARGHVGYG